MVLIYKEVIDNFIFYYNNSVLLGFIVIFGRFIFDNEVENIELL